jgi:hypothetical protein
MGTTGVMVAQVGRVSLGYAQQLLNGVEAARFARFATPGGVVLRSNHPAFVFGHLNLYACRVLGLLGLPEGPALPPPQWNALFKAGVECRDDPEGTIYPPMETLTRFFFDSYGAVLKALPEVGDEAFLRENPAEGRMKEMFPIVGSAVTFLVSGHIMTHLGQFSAWRRGMGLPAA